MEEGRPGGLRACPPSSRLIYSPWGSIIGSMTTGRGTYTMEPASYEPVPEAMAVEILREAKERREKKK